ncbi:hypothetical protein QTJ16_006529 [Diplocarpon rosae]|uniref:Zn(2)-C6 fungal-type domain-containing protein n=1 Tax=Diplocarpon rosae TaxID=946125 RepID=A0AAD9WA68_9HELO|nr:hypothetical protein QTJ16_006529 [Diplocarpon rosae]
MAKKCDQCVKARVPCTGIEFGATGCRRCARLSKECTWEREEIYRDNTEVSVDRKAQVAQEMEGMKETLPPCDMQFETSRGPAGENLEAETSEETNKWALKNDPEIGPKPLHCYPGQEKLLCCDKARVISKIYAADGDGTANDLYDITEVIKGTYPARVVTEPKVKYGVIWTDFFKIIGISVNNKIEKKRKFQMYGVNESATDVVEINHEYPELITLSESFTVVQDSLVRLSAGITWACNNHPDVEWTVFEIGWYAQLEAKRRAMIWKICEDAGQNFDAMMMEGHFERMQM